MLQQCPHDLSKRCPEQQVVTDQGVVKPVSSLADSHQVTYNITTTLITLPLTFHLPISIFMAIFQVNLG